MKLKALFSTLLVAGVVLGSSAAMAAPGGHHSSVNRINIGALDARIDSGVATGKLTRGEERVLRSELKSLRYSLKMALKDHRLSSRELNSLERKESKLKRNIYKLSNNRVTVSGSYNNHGGDHHNDYRDHDDRQPNASIHYVPSGSIGYVK